MNPEADPSDRIITFRTAVMLACCLAVIALAGFLAYRTSSPQPPAPPASAQPAPAAPAPPAAPTIP